MESLTNHMIFLEALVDSINHAALYNKDDQSAPVVVLWTDKDRLWEALIPQIRQKVHLLTFDPIQFQPEEGRGPAYYLRCLLTGVLPGYNTMGGIPVIYLPGVSRQEMRAVEECPKALQPLVELQYRGAFFTQKNAKDWTIAAFLQSKDGGLGIEVASDQATRDALRQTLLKLVDVPVSDLQKAAPIKDAYLFTLLNPDDTHSLLCWLNDPEGYPRRLTPEEWSAFVGVCKTKYDFQPEKDGPISAAERLGTQRGAWRLAWERYLLAPHLYPNIPDRLRSAKPTQLSLFERSESWPQDNEAEENLLRQSLLELEKEPFQVACLRIVELNGQHAHRLYWVWSRLSQTPLASALQHLSKAVAAMDFSAGIEFDDLIRAYSESGWQVDAAVLDALTCVETPEDITALRATLQAIYRPWLENSALAFQKAATDDLVAEPQPMVGKGTCILFTDALRYDLACRLKAALESRGYTGKLVAHLAAWPPVTATAKPALHPLADQLTGKGSAALDPMLRTSRSPLTAEAFRKLIVEAGFQVLRDDDLGDPAGSAWSELGEIDAYGHEHSGRLPVHIQNELLVLEKRIAMLLDYGWKEVQVITDHGWLYLPGGLPKIHLPEHLTLLRKGRCARLKEGAVVDMPAYRWYWDRDVWVVGAPGIACFEAGKEYEHGGLSPQECVTPVLIVLKTEITAQNPVAIHSIHWKKLRCAIQVDGVLEGMLVDLRSKAADPTTSVAKSPKSPDPSGDVSLVVEDEDRMGQAVFAVVLTNTGQPCAQALTTIGG